MGKVRGGNLWERGSKGISRREGEREDEGGKRKRDKEEGLSKEKRRECLGKKENKGGRVRSVGESIRKRRKSGREGGEREREKGGV